MKREDITSSACWARIESDRYEVGLVEADTRDLATSEDERVETVGDGVPLETDAQSLKRADEAEVDARQRYAGNRLRTGVPWAASTAAA
jgi:hypothetical protein